jgi:hypothetical protein
MKSRTGRGRRWPTDAQTATIEESMDRQARLQKLRRKAFLTAEWTAKQIE